MYRFLVLFLVLRSLFTPVSADKGKLIQCAGTSSIVSSIYYEKDSVKDKACERALEVERTAAKLYDFLKVSPKPFPLRVVEKSDEAAHEGDTLVLAGAPVLDGVKDSEMMREATIVHEVGHHIIKEYLIKNVDFIREYDQFYKKRTLALKKWNEDYLPEYERLQRSGKSAEEATDFMLSKHPSFENMLKELMEINSRPEMDLVPYVWMPYHELFADLVAVIFFKDLDVMFKAIHTEKTPEIKMKFYRPRSFSRENKTEEIRGLNDPHTTLSPIRSYLGQLIKKNPTQGQQLELLNRVRDIIVEEINYFYSKHVTSFQKMGNYKGKGLDITLMNMRILEKLED